jgi:hypothetical protein
VSITTQCLETLNHRLRNTCQNLAINLGIIRPTQCLLAAVRDDRTILTQETISQIPPDVSCPSLHLREDGTADQILRMVFSPEDLKVFMADVRMVMRSRTGLMESDSTMQAYVCGVSEMHDLMAEACEIHQSLRLEGLQGGIERRMSPSTSIRPYFNASKNNQRICETYLATSY